ncbi:MAG: hypothetical protein IKA58_06920, partial [Clostridia bacterium]|nr:hypothetical protein [Clostridia bacterium]
KPTYIGQDVKKEALANTVSSEKFSNGEIVFSEQKYDYVPTYNYNSVKPFLLIIIKRLEKKPIL